MVSVTQRIKEVKQPYGGYLRPREMSVMQLSDGRELNSAENISPSITGIVVDYLVRYVNGATPKDAFGVSLNGAMLVGELGVAGLLLADLIDTETLSDEGIRVACKLAGYDVAFRAGVQFFNGIDTIEPDIDTCENIRIMVERTMKFIEHYGPITQDGFNFAGGGYTQLVDSGDGDFLTKHVLWDLKTIRGEITSRNTLQLLMYYLMGIMSDQDIYKTIDEVAFFNPRRHEIHSMKISLIPEDIMEAVGSEVIGYPLAK